MHPFRPALRVESFPKSGPSSAWVSRWLGESGFRRGAEGALTPRPLVTLDHRGRPVSAVRLVAGRVERRALPIKPARDPLRELGRE